MTKNLWSEERDLLCLNCARRIVAPRRQTSKYGPLREYLWRRGTFANLITLSFSKIEGIINADLPFNALRNAKWWRNTEATTQGYAWTSVGWRAQNVNLEDRTVTFKKQLEEGKAGHMKKKRRRRTKTSQTPFTPVPVRIRRIRQPSKTRIAQALARAKNVERKKASKPYKTKLKPKSAYEKRIYDPEAKPTS
ncbi:MAG: hypothetical protein JSW72_00590 [Candidatus Bathyarchaeota archaeon]|nr:MAG: hypothetical protein JSW72_00590 [Candidatus Bathyarchaeota archaeon]